MCLRAEQQLHLRCDNHINKLLQWVWTAGQRVNPNIKSNFVLKRSIYPGTMIKDCPMRYTKWWRPTREPYHEPNWHGGAAGRESCLNIWPNKGCTWNDFKMFQQIMLPLQIPSWQRLSVLNEQRVNTRPGTKLVLWCWCCQCYYNIEGGVGSVRVFLLMLWNARKKLWAYYN